MDDVVTRLEMYCIVPSDLAEELLVPLRAHFSDQGIKVIEERRDPRQRLTLDLRRQRAMHLPRALTDLPEPLAEHAQELQLVQRMPAPGLVWADHSLVDVTHAVRDGEPVAASELVWRISARVSDRLEFRHGQRGYHMLEAALGSILDRLGEFTQYEEHELLRWIDDVVDDLR